MGGQKAGHYPDIMLFCSQPVKEALPKKVLLLGRSVLTGENGAEATSQRRPPVPVSPLPALCLRPSSTGPVGKGAKQIKKINK